MKKSISILAISLSALIYSGIAQAELTSSIQTIGPTTQQIDPAQPKKKGFWRSAGKVAAVIGLTALAVVAVAVENAPRDEGGNHGGGRPGSPGFGGHASGHHGGGDRGGQGGGDRGQGGGDRGQGGGNHGGGGDHGSSGKPQP